MRLGIKLLNVGASLNSFQQVTEVKIARGETLNLCFQLVDLDQKGLRYIPASGATVAVTLPRSNEVVALNNSYGRQTVNNSIERAATTAFGSDDRSIWMIPLTSTDTASLISNSIKVEVTEGGNKKIANLSQAIKIISDYEG